MANVRRVLALAAAITDVKEKAGVIASYDADAGTLTITLYAGGELTGTVTDNTRVKCEDDTAVTPTEPTDPTAASSGHSGPGHHSEDESEDDSSEDSSGEDEAGDDEAGHEGHHGDCGGNCSIADLADGVEVTEANVKYTADGAVFTELEIVKPGAAA